MTFWVAQSLSQCETRDKAQKAINQYAWAAEDAAQAAKNAHNTAAHAKV